MPETPDPRERPAGGWRLIAAWLLPAALILALLPFAYTGWFARYQADDYCSAQLLRTEGYWAAQWSSYSGWSNRFATMLITGLIDPLDVFGLRILPALLTAGLVAAAALLLLRLRALTGTPLRNPSLLALAAGGVFFSLYTLPSRFQSLYWRSGSITYTLPVIALLLLLAILLKRSEGRPAWQRLILTGLLAFFAAGFSETNAALQTAVIVLGLAAVLWSARRGARKDLSRAAWAAALSGTLLALAVMALAPGNAVRMSQMPTPPALLTWLTTSLRFGWDFLKNTTAATILPRLASLLFGAALAARLDWRGASARRIAGWLLAVPLAVYLLAVACCAPSVYAQSAYPEDRALSGANFVLSAGLMLEGALLGALTRRWLANLRLVPLAGGLALVGLSAYALYGGWQALGGAAEERARAAAWDARAAQIAELRAAGATRVEVNALDSIGGIAELSADPGNWVNGCAAGYYGVEEIVGH